MELLEEMKKSKVELDEIKQRLNGLYRTAHNTKKKFYRLENKDKIKSYNEKNKERDNKRKLEWTKKNKERLKDKIREQKKIYREKNREKINEKNAEEVECEKCHCIVSRGWYPRHKKISCTAIVIHKVMD